MFGLESGKPKPKKKEEFLFDLEKELVNPLKMREYVKKVEVKILRIKHLMRSGDHKQVYDRLNSLLQAYNGMLKVFSRIKHKIKP
jgi:hypothetical protein